jgi:hypothetical protein
MSFWCLQFLPKNEQKLRYHSSKNEFIRSFFGRIHGLTICLRVLLTFKKSKYKYFPISIRLYVGMAVAPYELDGE